MGRKLSTGEFIEKAKKIHGDVYDYSLVDYRTSADKVKIVCKIHGLFEQIPTSHLIGKGCKWCGIEKRIKKQKQSTEEFIHKSISIHGNVYDYSLTKYHNSKNKIKIICNKHGVFEQKPYDHLDGHGCSWCGIAKNTRKKLFTTKEFIKNAKFTHGVKYDYSHINYKGATSKIKIVCKKHGQFSQTAYSHLAGHGCPKCTHKISKPELELQEYIKSIYPHKVITNTRKIVSPYELDIYLPDINLAIEFNGDYWHSSEDAKRRDKKTKQLCMKNGIRLMIVWERYWINKKESMKATIRRVLSK